VTNAISFMSANYVAREVGFDMHGWGHGDRATNDRFRPLETFRERLEELLVKVRTLGFDTVDVWSAHLNPEWATDEHLEIARTLLDRHGLRVASLAVWPDSVAGLERACDIAETFGASLLGGGVALDRELILPVLRERGIRLGIENHPERTPAELLAKIGGDETIGATVDTGWWATQGYDAVRAIEELGERVLHVHLKDVLSSGEPHETCRWGDGIVDVEGCVRALQRLEYAGAITVEHEPEDHDPSEECREMLTVLRAWLR